MQLRTLPTARLVALTLVVLLLAFDFVTYYYVVTNGTSLTSLVGFDGVISGGVLLLAFGLWRAPTVGRAVKLTFVAAGVLFTLWVLATGFLTPFTEFISVLLVLAALATTITGVFMRKGS
jgi:hypothetical protein